MRYSRKHRLIEIEWPEFGECGPPPRPPVGEFEARIDVARSALERLGLTHLVFYGDREHFANLAYLTGFLDEWLSSPIYPGSTVLLHSGMVMQVDVIPFSPAYFSTRMEDRVVIADESLRHRLQEQFQSAFHAVRNGESSCARHWGFRYRKRFYRCPTSHRSCHPFS